MLRQLLKLYVRLAAHLFFHSIEVSNKELLKSKGPLLIASNHPNSFLDAILLEMLFDVPITALARGDAFKSKKMFRLLRRLKILPIYRLREEAENLNINYKTFDACVDIFRKEEAILIFSEGLCVNEWHLRPLGKDTARLAFRTWKEEVPLVVLPTGINYSGFRKYGSKVNVHVGNFITAQEFNLNHPEGSNLFLFNKKLKDELGQLVYEINYSNDALLVEYFGSTSPLMKIMLAPLGYCVAVLHGPLLGLAILTATITSKNKVHFDSVFFAVLVLGYPIYLLLAALATCYFVGAVWVLLAVAILPITAFCCARFEIRKGSA